MKLLYQGKALCKGKRQHISCVVFGLTRIFYIFVDRYISASILAKYEIFSYKPHSILYSYNTELHKNTQVHEIIVSGKKFYAKAKGSISQVLVSGQTTIFHTDPHISVPILAKYEYFYTNHI